MERTEANEITSTNNNSPAPDSILSLKNVVFTLHEGKLLVAPKDPHDLNVPGALKTASLVGFEPHQSQSDEIHIEIIRENTAQLDHTDHTVASENNITNLSSAYEAFWKHEFEKCIERRTCTECAQVLLTPLRLFHHWKLVHENLHPSECFICHKIFSNEEETNEHILKIHSILQPERICEVCLEVFSNELDKKNHRALHLRNISCKWCQDSFPCEFLLNVHQQKCLQLKENLVCLKCGCHFKSSHMLQLHRLRHTRNICDICKISLPSKPNVRSDETEVDLIRHIKTCHSQDEVKNILATLRKQDEEEETLDKLFMNHEPIVKILDSNLTKQLSQTNLQQQFSDVLDHQALAPSVDSTSESCEDLILSKAALQCTECLKNFVSKEELLTHDLEHQMPFCCHICEEKFPHRRRFKKHMRSHGILVKPGVPQYRCKECSISCNTMSGLRVHLLTHTNQKPYLCDKCGLKFRRAQALRVHENTVHSTRTLHTCSLCGSGSLSRPSLLRHIQCVHGGVRRFICGLCGTRFLQNQDLRKHLKRIHDSDFPPVDRVSKLSNKQIHVIPSMENINPTDPLAVMLKSAIKEEQSKLMALCQKGGKTNFNERSDQFPMPENCTDGILLNILGDVASKAAPLEHTNASEILKPITNQDLHTHTKFLCAGCQYLSDTLTDFSVHLAQCHQEKSNEPAQKKSVNPPLSPKEACYLSTNPSFLSSGNSLVNPLCIISSQNNGSVLHNGPSLTSTCDNNYICSVMNLGATIPSSQAVTYPLAVGSVYCSNTVINESCIVTSEQTVLDNDPVKGFTNIIHGESLKLSHLDLPNRVHSHSVSSQIISISRDSIPSKDVESCKLQEPSGVDVALLNASVDNTCADLTQSNCDAHKRDTAFDTSLRKPPVEFLTNEETYQSEEKTATLMTLPTDQEIFPNSSVPRRGTNPLEPSSTSISKCSSFKPITYNRCLPAKKPRISNIKISNLKKESSSSPDISSVSSVSLTHSIGSKCNSPSVNTSSAASSIALEFHANVCPECGKKFSCASNFKRHLAVHFGQKAHECLYCGKTFRYKCNLTVHIRSHTRAKPYECPECKKKFRYQTELKEHKQSHEKSPSLSCKECGRNFMRQRDLKRHCLSHNSKQRPTCYICQKPFSRLDYLKIHIKSHRKQEEVSDGSEKRKRNEENVSQKISGKKTRHQKELLFVCGFCSSSFSSLKEKKAHQVICNEYVQEVSNDSQNQDLIDTQSVKNTTILSGVVDTSTSEDLISLAYQAAEDGVEFMFVEENSLVINDVGTEVQDQNVESNVIYVEVLDQN